MRDQLKRIESITVKQMVFSERKKKLFKAAKELSVLCDAEIALIIFSDRGEVYDFSSKPRIMSN